MIEKAKNNLIAGILWMALSTLLYVIQEALIKSLTSELHPFSIVLFRNLFGLLFMLPILIKQRFEPLRVINWKLMFLRAAFGFSAMLSYIYALKFESFLTAGTVSLLVPLVAGIFAPYFLNEKSSLYTWAMLGLAFIGALFVVYSQGNLQVAWNYGVVFAFVSVIFNAGIFVLVKILTRTESNITISSWMCITQLLLSLPLAIGHWRWPNLSTLAYLALTGILAAVAQIALAQALRENDAHSMIPSSFLRLIWIFLLGIFFFQETPHFFGIAGACIIVFSNTAMLSKAKK